MRRNIAGLILLASSLASGQAKITLTDIHGRKADVEIVGASPADLTIVMEGRKSTLKLDQLSEPSRKSALDYARSKGVFDSFPAVSVLVKVGYQRRNSAGSFYRKDMTLKPSVVIEGVSKMDTTIPATEATMMIITHDTNAKYVKHVDKLTVYSIETIKIPSGSGDRREIVFAPAETSFDTARDFTNVGGDEYQYFIFGLRDPATKKLVNFQTNCPKIATRVAAHPELRENFFSLKKGASFIEDPPAAK